MPQKPAGHRQSLNEANALGADFGPGEQPVVFSQGNEKRTPFQRSVSVGTYSSVNNTGRLTGLALEYLRALEKDDWRVDRMWWDVSFPVRQCSASARSDVMGLSANFVFHTRGVRSVT